MDTYIWTMRYQHENYLAVYRNARFFAFDNALILSHLVPEYLASSTWVNTDLEFAPVFHYWINCYSDKYPNDVLVINDRDALKELLRGAA